MAHFSQALDKDPFSIVRTEKIHDSYPCLMRI